MYFGNVIGERSFLMMRSRLFSRFHHTIIEWFRYFAYPRSEKGYTLQLINF